jgi:hypothetical protein
MSDEPHVHDWVETNLCLVVQFGIITDPGALHPVKVCSACGIVRLAYPTVGEPAEKGGL